MQVSKKIPTSLIILAGYHSLEAVESYSLIRFDTLTSQSQAVDLEFNCGEFSASKIFGFMTTKDDKDTIIACPSYALVIEVDFESKKVGRARLLQPFLCVINGFSVVPGASSCLLLHLNRHSQAKDKVGRLRFIELNVTCKPEFEYGNCSNFRINIDEKDQYKQYIILTKLKKMFDKGGSFACLAILDLEGFSGYPQLRDFLSLGRPRGEVQLEAVYYKERVKYAVFLVFHGTKLFRVFYDLNRFIVFRKHEVDQDLLIGPYDFVVYFNVVKNLGNCIDVMSSASKLSRISYYP